MGPLPDGKTLVDAIVSYKPPPVNHETVHTYYIPAFGTLNYTLLSINVMNPGLLQKIVPRPDLTNILLLNSCLGSALFIAGRPHIKEVPLKLRILFGLYGSVLFNMGSVLSWAVLRSLLPNNSGVTTIVGLISGCALTGCGVFYLNYNDKTVKADKK